MQLEDGDSVFTEESVRRVGDSEIRTIRKVENSKISIEDTDSPNKYVSNIVGTQEANQQALRSALYHLNEKFNSQ